VSKAPAKKRGRKPLTNMVVQDNSSLHSTNKRAARPHRPKSPSTSYITIRKPTYLTDGRANIQVLTPAVVIPSDVTVHAKPGKEVQHNQTVKPDQLEHVIEQVLLGRLKLVETMKPAKDMKSVEPISVVEKIQSVEDFRSTEQIQSFEDIQPFEEIQSAEELLSISQIQSFEDIQSFEQVQQPQEIVEQIQTISPHKDIDEDLQSTISNSTGIVSTHIQGYLFLLLIRDF